MSYAIQLQMFKSIDTTHFFQRKFAIQQHMTMNENYTVMYVVYVDIDPHSRLEIRESSSILHCSIVDCQRNCIYSIIKLCSYGVTISVEADEQHNG